MITRVDGNISWLLAEYEASWLDPWLQHFPLSYLSQESLLLKSCNFSQTLPSMEEDRVKS